MTGGEAIGGRLDIRARVCETWSPSYDDFGADLAGYFKAAHDWCRDNPLLKERNADLGYDADDANVIERDIHGYSLHWLQGLYFARGLHDLVAEYFLAKPYWDRESRPFHAHNEFTRKLMTKSDGLPLEQYRQSFDALARSGRPDLAIRIWRRILEAALDDLAEAKGEAELRRARLAVIDLHDLARPLIEAEGAAEDRGWLTAIAKKVPTSPFSGAG